MKRNATAVHEEHEQVRQMLSWRPLEEARGRRRKLAELRAWTGRNEVNGPGPTYGGGGAGPRNTEATRWPVVRQLRAASRTRGKPHIRRQHPVSRARVCASVCARLCSCVCSAYLVFSRLLSELNRISGSLCLTLISPSWCYFLSNLTGFAEKFARFLPSIAGHVTVFFLFRERD